MLLARPPVMRWNAFGNIVIRLLVYCEDRHLGLKTRWIIQGSNLNYKRTRSRWTSRPNSSAAGAAEKACNWTLQIFAHEARWRALCKKEPFFGNNHDSIWIAASYILALAAVAL